MYLILKLVHKIKIHTKLVRSGSILLTLKTVQVHNYSESPMINQSALPSIDHKRSESADGKRSYDIIKERKTANNSFQQTNGFRKNKKWMVTAYSLKL